MSVERRTTFFAMLFTLKATLLAFNAMPFALEPSRG
jgi:hypothetical protein